jgi:hypothetical protein
MGSLTIPMEFLRPTPVKDHFFVLCLPTALLLDKCERNDAGRAAPAANTKTNLNGHKSQSN